MNAIKALEDLRVRVQGVMRMVKVTLSFVFIIIYVHQLFEYHT